MDEPIDFPNLPISPDLKQTVVNQIVDTLRSAIQRGDLKDGVELNQVALAEHFGISRVPIREALRSLQAEGWISALPHRRAVVQAVSTKRIAETFEIRALLEAHLVTKAVPLDEKRLAELKSILDQMDRMTDPQDWVSANRKFHRLLLEPADSDMAIEMVEQLTVTVERYIHRFLGKNVLREGEGGREHREILDAVEKGEPGIARALVLAHISRTGKRVIAAMEAARYTKVP